MNRIAKAQWFWVAMFTLFHVDGFASLTSGFPSPSNGYSRVITRSKASNIQMPPLDTNGTYGTTPRGNGASINGAKVTAEKNIDRIFDQNRKWKESKLQEDPDFFTKLGDGHHPSFFFIGCADARVPSTEIIGEKPGSVFVVRNVANMVVNTDINLMSALQYAVEVLRIPHIIVCGHYDCGGVRAAIAKKGHVPLLESWLRNIRDVYRLHKQELNEIKDPEQRHRRLVELNVREQCINLFKTGTVQKSRAQSSEGDPFVTPQIHACVFDPKTGDLKRLEVDLEHCVDEIQDIYSLELEEEKMDDCWLGKAP